MASAEPIRTIRVFGGGVVALSAAIAFRRALPNADVAVLATPVAPAALADRLGAAPPSIHAFHTRIGLAEAQLVRACGATHRLALEFQRWRSDDRSFRVGYGAIHAVVDGIALHQLWARAGEALPFDSLGIAAQLAARGRFQHPDDTPGAPLADLDYGLRFDMARYARLLEALAAHLGIAIAPARIAHCEVSAATRRITSVRLEDGRSIAADLFIDCTGPDARLLTALDDRFEDWQAALPCDRLLLAPPASASRYDPGDQITAVSAGWRWEAPGMTTAARGMAYASATTSDSRAERVFRSAFATDAGECVAIRPGRRPHSWIGNVLALGDGAIAVDPLQWTHLHLVHGSLDLALALLPGRDCHPLEITEFNRRNRQFQDRVRDFMAAHYVAATRREGEFWRALKPEPPESLQRSLDSFRRRGRLPHFEEESFARDAWLAVLLGLGFAPAGPDAATLRVPADRAAHIVERFRARAAAAAEKAPEYNDYYARLLRSATA